MNKISFLSVLIFLSIWYNLSAQVYVGKITIDRRNVFDSTNGDWFFAAPLVNSMHYLTQEYVIKDELLFNEDEELDMDLIDESERNLRAMGLFSDVDIVLDSADEESENVRVITHDLWSTSPSISFKTGGEAQEYGARIDELNFLGTGTKLFFESLYRSENNIGLQGDAGIYQRRLFRLPVTLDAFILAHKYRTEQHVSIQKPYLNIETPNSFGFDFRHNFGQDFIFRDSDSSRLDPFYERSLSDWYSLAWRKEDRVFMTLLTDVNYVNRSGNHYRRAYDNTGKILLGFSSLSQKFFQLTKLNNYRIEDVPIGGWGTAIIGFVFPTGHMGDRLFYVGGQGEKSTLIGNLYLYGQVTGASGFGSGRAYYTYQEFQGLGYYRLSPVFLLAARVRQQASWNWDAYRQLILDNDYGLRGYTVNSLAGDNRALANLELRMFPDIGWWIFQLSGVAFYDVGTVWNRGEDLTKTRFHNAAGLGIRIHNKKAAGSQNIVRIDLAFNFDENRVAEIIISSDQLFSVFGKHEFKLPEVYGLEFNNE